MNMSFNPRLWLDPQRRFGARGEGAAMDYRPGAYGEDESNVVTSSWVPEVDIFEEDNRFLLRADVPGVAADRIEVVLEEGKLTIRGERLADGLAQGEEFRRIERTYGRFYRRFALPASADGDGITASASQGVLTVIIPKSQRAQSRRIDVGA